MGLWGLRHGQWPLKTMPQFGVSVQSRVGLVSGLHLSELHRKGLEGAICDTGGDGDARIALLTLMVCGAPPTQA